MKKQNMRLGRALKPHGFAVVNAIGHGANIVDASGRCVAKVHLEDDRDVQRAMALLKRRGHLAPHA